MPISVEHAAPSQRRHYRLTVPLIIIINGVEYLATDWSIAGFRIKGFSGTIHEGARLPVYVKIPFSGFEVGFPTTVDIIRQDPDRAEMVALFKEIDERQRETLNSFIKGVTSGEIEEVEGILRRFDIPVTPAAIRPESSPISAEAAARKKQLGMRLYTIVGAIIGVLILIALYSNVLQLKITTSVIMGKNNVMASPTIGAIDQALEPNTQVKAGDALLTISDPKLETDLQIAELKVREAQVEVDRLNAMVGTDKKRFSASNDIALTEWKSSTQTVKTLEQNLRVKESSINRTRKLAQGGYVSNAMLEKEQSEYLDLQRQLNEAKMTESRLAQELEAVKSGFQVRDKSVQTSIQDTLELRKAALERLEIAKAQYSYLQKQRDRLTLRAPSDGLLARVFEPVGSTAKYGDPLVVFEEQGKRQVQAFLTQEEALQITIGQKARVYYAGRWFSIPHKVTDIDFYSLTLNQAQGRLQWQNFLNEQFKTVIVTLEPASDDALKEMLTVPSGTGATVAFSRI